MRKVSELVGWGILTAVILTAALGGEQPLVTQSPGIALALGVIGLGLCKHAKERAAATTAAAVTETTSRN